MPFDPRRYFEKVERLLNSDHHIGSFSRNGPKISPNLENWSIIAWRETVEFLSGHKLDFSDNYRSLAGQVMRSFRFHFGDEHGRLVFRFDNHGRHVHCDAPCHLHIPDSHIPSEDVIEDGDKRLNGLSLIGVDFLVVHKLIHRFFKSGELPWL